MVITKTKQSIEKVEAKLESFCLITNRYLLNKAGEIGIAGIAITAAPRVGAVAPILQEVAHHERQIMLAVQAAAPNLAAILPGQSRHPHIARRHTYPAILHPQKPIFAARRRRPRSSATHLQFDHPEFRLKTRQKLDFFVDFVFIPSQENFQLSTIFSSFKLQTLHSNIKETRNRPKQVWIVGEN